MNDSAEKVWANCLSLIRDNVPLQSFKTWFEPIKPVKLEGKVLTIQVPSVFFYEWLEEHYVTLLKKALKKELGQGGKLEYNIIVDASAKGTMNLPAQGSGTEDDLEILVPGNVGVNIKNPFIIPGLKRITIDAQLNAVLIFENFIEGDCNRLARAAGVAVGANPGKTSFNPLFIHGGVGLGKTHLAQAIGNQIRAFHKQKVVLYVTSEKFTNQFAEASRNETITDFVNFYQCIDVLLVDDVQFFSGKTKTQDVFFHIFNHLHQNGKQLVLTSDRAPKDIPDVDERLISRFKWGLSADLQVPDYETRIAILEQKMYRDGITMPRELVEYIAYNIQGSVRELEGALVSLIARSTLTRHSLDINLAKEVIRHFVQSANKVVSIEQIQKFIGEAMAVEVEMLTSKTRKRNIVLARQIAMFFSKQLTKNSLATIGRAFGGRDHSTVIHACQTISDLMETDGKFKSKMHDLEKMLNINFT